MGNKNFYSILELDRGCSQDDIKKSFRRLAVVFHPDKNGSPDATERFIDIKLAYEVLNDPVKRGVYDRENEPGQSKIYDGIIDLVKQMAPADLHNGIEVFFKNGFVQNMFDRFMKVDSSESKVGDAKPNEKPDKVRKEDLDISSGIYATYNEKYMDLYRKILVKRNTKPDIILFVPLRNELFKVVGEGETVDGVNGDIIITVITMDKENYENSIVGHDIHLEYEISLYSWLYGGTDQVEVCEENIDVEHDSFVERFPLVTVVGAGMPYEDGEGAVGIARGNLIVQFKIKGLQLIADQVRAINST
jgi:DnaJ-class molecular chaperone